MKDEPYEWRLMGVSCTAYRDEQQAEAHVAFAVRQGVVGYTVAINAEKLMRCDADPQFRRLVQQAAIKVPDGAGAVLALRLLCGARSAKVDFPRASLAAADRLGAECRLGVIGATTRSNEAAVAAIARHYPNAHIVVNRSGYVVEDDLLEDLLRARPQLCLVAMGTPKQELFAMRAVQAGVPCLFVGCGGALDILSGQSVRAPAWMVDNYLEWLYRLLQQPSRWRRQLVLPLFLIKLIGERLRTMSR